MKITTELLKSHNIDKQVINKFINTKELHDIDFKNTVDITTSDDDLDNLFYKLTSGKNRLPIRKLINVSSKAYFVEKTFDLIGNWLTAVKYNGERIQFIYDVNNRCVEYRESTGAHDVITYNEKGKRIASISQTGKISYYYDYDENGNCIKYYSSDGFFVKYTYDINGNELTSINSDGQCISKTYDASGNMTKTTSYKNGDWYKSNYDNNGNELSSINSKGEYVVMTYDDRNNCISRYKSNGSWTNTYNENNCRLKYEGSDGKIITFNPKEEKFNLSKFSINNVTFFSRFRIR